MKLTGIPLVLQLMHNMLHIGERVYRLDSDAVLELEECEVSMNRG